MEQLQLNFNKIIDSYNVKIPLTLIINYSIRVNKIGVIVPNLPHLTVDKLDQTAAYNLVQY